MSDFLGRLAERALGLPPAIVPLTSSRFEDAADDEPWDVLEELVEPASPGRPVDAPPAEAARQRGPPARGQARPRAQLPPEPRAAPQPDDGDRRVREHGPRADAPARPRERATAVAAEAPEKASRTEYGEDSAPERARPPREPGERRERARTPPTPPRTRSRDARADPPRAEPPPRQPRALAKPDPALPRPAEGRGRRDGRASSVQVAIDRIHVHADGPPRPARTAPELAPTRPPHEPASPQWSPRRLSLDEYLRRGTAEP